MDSHSEQYAESHGVLCARIRMTPGQRAGYSLALVALLAAFAASPYVAWVAVSYVLSLVIAVALGFRVAAMVLTLIRDPAIRVSSRETEALVEDSLPVYSILVPLHREPHVVPALLQALAALDYPRGKLDIQLLLEPDDFETLAVLRRQSLPAHIRLTLSPGGMPQTKPRACNAGLTLAKGELLVIYDAEDRPEPDQLRKAVAAYGTVPPRVVCLQCRLAHYNSMQGLFAQWSAMEYLVWYRLLLPGLQRMGAPIPLGGTSNHFRVSALRELGGWDPFNMTEDCDLGMRIARRGWLTWMLDSTTWEESVTRLGAWLNQRSRWVKGYWQTWLVHSRAGALGAMGAWKWLQFLFTIGLSTILLLLNPLLWAVIALWFVVGWPIVDVASPASIAALGLSMALLAANLIFLGINMAACVMWRKPELASAALISPLEWALLSAGAWKGFWQFFTKPFHWEKTAHGIAVFDDELRKRSHWLLRASSPALSFFLLLLVCAGVAGAVALRVQKQIEEQAPLKAVQLPTVFAAAECGGADFLDEERAAVWFEGGTPTNAVGAMPAGGSDRPLELAAAFPGELTLRCQPEADWSRLKGAIVEIALPADAPEGIQVLFYLKDRDALWYQRVSPQALVPGARTRVEADFRDGAGGWDARGHRKPWNDYTLQRVTEFGVRLFSRNAYKGPVSVARMRAVRLAPEEMAARVPAIRDVHLSAQQVGMYGKIEIDFNVPVAFANPFDPDVVDIQGRITQPDGSRATVPAFIYQPFERRLADGHEELTATGAESWKIRFAPTMTGRHEVVVHLAMRGKDVMESEPVAFESVASSRRGFVRRSGDRPELMVHQGGESYYPLGHNICWPVDTLQPYPYEFPAQKDEGTFSYDHYLDRMASSGENWARIWMSPGWLGLEGSPRWQGFHGAGRYNLANAWRLDHIVNVAEEKGICVQLTLQHYSEYNRLAWPDSAYNLANGGPCRDATELLTNPDAMRLFKNRLRYVVARWGYSPNIMAWELWGEVNLFPGFTSRTSQVWHEKMIEHLAAIDPWRHLVFTHCHNWRSGNDLWQLAGIDCVQGNGYIRPPNRTVNHVDNFRRYVSEVEQYRKPIFVAEYGGRSELGAPNADYLEAQLHSGLWASLVHPFGGAAMNWWWNFIDGRDLYRHFKAASAFNSDIDRVKNRFTVVTPLVEPEGTGLCAAGMQSDDLGFHWVYHTNVFTTCALPEVTNAVLVADAEAARNYRVEVWDTRRGGVIAETTALSDGRVRVALPPFVGDIAVKLHRRPRVESDAR